MPSSSEATRPRRTWVAAVFIGTLVVLVGASVWILVQRSEPAAAPTVRTDVSVPGIATVGSPAPGFTLRNLDSAGSVSYSPGQPTVLTFWASWCAPCRKEFPLLERAQRDNPDIRIIGSLYKDIPADARDFVRETGATWPNGIDDDSGIARAYGVRAIPQTFFIDAQGVIRSRVFGFTSAGELQENLDLIR